MAAAIEVKVPDIGDFKDVPVIEVHGQAGRQVKAEDSLVTLESDKATMDVPAPLAGMVKEVKVKVGDKVSEGSADPARSTPARRAAAAAADAPKTSVSSPPAPTSAPAGVAEVRVPDIGDFKDVPVIEVLVKPGDIVKAEDAARHARIRQGDDGRARAARRHRARHQRQGRRQGVAKARSC